MKSMPALPMAVTMNIYVPAGSRSNFAMPPATSKMFPGDRLISFLPPTHRGDRHEGISIHVFARAARHGQLTPPNGSQD